MKRKVLLVLGIAGAMMFATFCLYGCGSPGSESNLVCSQTDAGIDCVQATCSTCHCDPKTAVCHGSPCVDGGTCE